MLDRISMVGLGQLGASMAAALASRRLSAVGADVRHRLGRPAGVRSVGIIGMSSDNAANSARLAALWVRASH